MSLPPPPPRASKPIGEKEEFTQLWSGWFRSVWKLLHPGINTTITIPMLTPVTGTNGSITVQNGIITSVVEPT